MKAIKNYIIILKKLFKIKCCNYCVYIYHLKSLMNQVDIAFPASVEKSFTIIWGSWNCLHANSITIYDLAVNGFSVKGIYIICAGTFIK
jgi:hypothetical protein